MIDLIVSLVFKALHGLAPAHLSDILTIYEPVQSLLSCGTSLLLVPKCITKTFGSISIHFNNTVVLLVDASVGYGALLGIFTSDKVCRAHRIALCSNAGLAPKITFQHNQNVDKVIRDSSKNNLLPHRGGVALC